MIAHCLVPPSQLLRQTFTLDAGAFKKITFTLSLDDTVKLNQVVEGFIKFKAADDRQSISVPYMGYYGSTNDEAVFDKPRKRRRQYL
jgi:hypothetical protein